MGTCVEVLGQNIAWHKGLRLDNEFVLFNASSFGKICLPLKQLPNLQRHVWMIEFCVA